MFKMPHSLLGQTYIRIRDKRQKLHPMTIDGSSSFLRSSNCLVWVSLPTTSLKQMGVLDAYLDHSYVTVA